MFFISSKYSMLTGAFFDNIPFLIDQGELRGLDVNVNNPHLLNQMGITREVKKVHPPSTVVFEL